jgi:hypothetical protein
MGIALTPAEKQMRAAARKAEQTILLAGIKIRIGVFTPFDQILCHAYKVCLI